MSAFQSILDVLHQHDEPQIAAREIIAALREVPDEVRDIVSEPGAWIRLVDAMLGAADRVIADAYLAAAADRIQSWPRVLSDLEALGCQLLQFRHNPHRWRIEADGVDVELDLHTGELTGLDGTVVHRAPTISPDGFHEVTWTMDELVAGVAAGIHRRRKAIAKKARRSAANENRH